MKKVIVDSSLVIDYLRTQRGPMLKLLKAQLDQEVFLIVPAIVRMEVWAGESMSDAVHYAKAESLFEHFLDLVLTAEVAQLAGKLIRTQAIFKKNKLDAIVAATAISQGGYVATLNTKHFRHVDLLDVLRL